VRPGRRWYRSPWFYLVTAAAALLLGGWGAYQRWGHAEPEPPDVDPAGLDPAIVAAVRAARAEVLRTPRAAAAWGRLGMVLVVHDFRAQADVCLARAEQLDPREPRWPYYQALGALLFGADPDAALPKLERTVALCGEVPDAPRVRLAELLLSQNRLDDAERHFRHLLEHHPGHPRALLGLARIALERGDPQGALGRLPLALQDRRTQKAAWLLAAAVRQRLGEQAAAEEARQRAAGLPDDPFWPDPFNEEATELRTGKDAWLKRARRYAQLGRDAEALALLQRTVEDYPEADDAWLQLGKLFLQRREPGAAEEALRQAARLAPQSHECIYYLGAALVVQGDKKAAADCFREAVKLKPDFAPAHHNLGNCRAEAGDTAGALDAYRKAVQYEPNLFEARLALATLLADKGQDAEALAHARQAARLRPANPEAQKLLGRLEKAAPRPAPP
jgi:tetratricopeptide (TPR) repeat protein